MIHFHCPSLVTPKPGLKQHAQFIMCTLKTWQHGVEEIAHWVKCLPCKSGDWSLDVRHPYKSQGHGSPPVLLASQGREKTPLQNKLVWVGQTDPASMTTVEEQLRIILDINLGPAHAHMYSSSWPRTT